MALSVDKRCSGRRLGCSPVQLPRPGSPRPRPDRPVTTQRDRRLAQGCPRLLQLQGSVVSLEISLASPRFQSLFWFRELFYFSLHKTLASVLTDDRPPWLQGGSLSHMHVWPAALPHSPLSPGVWRGSAPSTPLHHAGEREFGCCLASPRPSRSFYASARLILTLGAGGP